MTLTINFTAQEEAWLNAEAVKQCLSPDEIVRRIVRERRETPNSAPAAPFGFPPTGRFADYMRERLADEATDDPEEIRKAEEELAEMKWNMNEERPLGHGAHLLMGKVFLTTAQ